MNPEFACLKLAIAKFSAMFAVVNPALASSFVLFARFAPIG